EILEDDGDPGTPGVQVVGPDVGAVDGDPARLRLVQPGQQLDQGGLSGAVDTHDRGARPGRYAQRQVAEDRPVAMAGRGTGTAPGRRRWPPAAPVPECGRPVWWRRLAWWRRPDVTPLRVRTPA